MKFKTMKETIDRIENKFFKKLENKTGWGRNEIKKAFSDSVLEVLKEELDARMKIEKDWRERGEINTECRNGDGEVRP